MKLIADLAQHIRKAGYRPFIAESGTYGFFTDAEGTRVVSFQTRFGGVTFSGNYRSADPLSCGRGWAIDAGWEATAKGLFESCPPAWATKGFAWRFTTLAEHLKDYQSSSNYHEVTA